MDVLERLQNYIANRFGMEGEDKYFEYDEDGVLIDEAVEEFFQDKEYGKDYTYFKDSASQDAAVLSVSVVEDGTLYVTSFVIKEA